MKYKLNYGSGQLKFDIKIQLEDILRLSSIGAGNDETRIAERSREINDIIGKLYLKPSETKKNKNKPKTKYDKNKIKDILKEDELKTMEKYVFSFESGNNDLFKEYWNGRKRTEIPVITAIFFRCMLRIKYKYRDKLSKLWEDWSLITEEFNNNIYISQDEVIGFIKLEAEKKIEKEKERLGKSINNKCRSNKKIKELSSASIDEIVKELINNDDPNNNEENRYLNIGMIRDSSFKIIEHRSEVSLSNQIATDNLMKEIINLYNILPKEARYDATYKNLRNLKESIKFKIEEIENYKKIYEREAKKRCNKINEYKKEEEILREAGYKEKLEEVSEKRIKVEKEEADILNKQMKREMDIYIDMSFKKMDLEIEEMDMKKYENDNIMNSINKFIEDINSK